MTTKDTATGRERWGGLYRSGWTMQEIADANGISVSTVHNVLRCQGVRGRIGSTAHIEYEEMYRKGHSLAAVGEHFGVSRQAVQQSLKAWGVTRRGHNGLPIPTKQNRRGAADDTAD